MPLGHPSLPIAGITPTVNHYHRSYMSLRPTTTMLRRFTCGVRLMTSHNKCTKSDSIVCEKSNEEISEAKVVYSVAPALGHNIDKLNYLEQPIPPVPVAPAGQQVAPEILAAHSAWVKGSKEIAGLMLITMEPEIQQNLEPLHAHKMLKELKTLFAQQAEQELLQTTRDFHSYRQEEGQSVSSYVLKMKGYILL
nr:zinc finger, CCHC-type [Tanacetum cinerariifolium]